MLSANSADEAAKMAEDIGYPVVMKILSPDIIHKTDIGGVKLNIKSKNEAEEAYQEIVSTARQKMPKADIQGVFYRSYGQKAI